MGHKEMVPNSNLKYQEVYGLDCMDIEGGGCEPIPKTVGDRLHMDWVSWWNWFLPYSFFQYWIPVTIVFWGSVLELLDENGSSYQNFWIKL